jgi:SAM-dependent methyltransferase
VIIPREQHLANTYHGQRYLDPEDWAHCTLDGQIVSLYGPEIIQRYITSAILEHSSSKNLKEVDIFDIGAGDGRVVSEIAKSLVGVNPKFTMLEPSLSDPKSVVYQKYHIELYNPDNNIIPKTLEKIHDWVSFNNNSQDLVMSIFVLQYLANPERIKLLLETQHKLLKPGGIAINLWVGAKNLEESNWRTKLWLNIDKIRDPNISQKPIKELRKNWNQFDIDSFDNLVAVSRFKTIQRTVEISELEKWYDIEALTNGSRFKPIIIQSQVNAMKARFANTQELHEEHFKNSRIRLPMIYSILQKPLV